MALSISVCGQCYTAVIVGRHVVRSLSQVLTCRPTSSALHLLMLAVSVACRPTLSVAKMTTNIVGCRPTVTVLSSMHVSCDDKSDAYQNCTVLYCVHVSCDDKSDAYQNCTVLYCVHVSCDDKSDAYPLIRTALCCIVYT